MRRSGATAHLDPARLASTALLCAVALVWLTPFLWMLVAAFRPETGGSRDMASLVPPLRPTFENFVLAFESADFAVYYVNTLLVVGGILAVQLVTISLAGYAFARLDFPGKDVIFTLFLLQLMLVPPILIVPNLTTVVRLGIYDSLLGVMAPYLASAFA